MSDKRKHHLRGFNENSQEARAQRVSFKLYLRELEEESIEQDIYEDENELPDNDKDINEMLDAFISSDTDIAEVAREYDDPTDGTDYLMDQLTNWLRTDGHSSDDIEAWMDKHDDKVFDYLYNGLT